MLLNKCSVNSLLDEFFDYSVNNSHVCSSKNDLVKYDGRYELLLEVPGVNKKDIKIDLDKKCLNITFEKKKGYNEEKATLLSTSNRSSGVFKQCYVLPDNVDIKGITAEAKNGVLTVKLPKSEDSKPIKISVS